MEELIECKQCFGVFEISELDEDFICEKCQEENEKYNMSMQETYNSLYISER